jgi:hypothetical protein
MYLNQGRLNSIIGSQGKAVHGGLLPTQTTQRNKNVNVYRIKNIFIALVLSAKATYYRLAWGPYARGASGKLPSVPMR